MWQKSVRMTELPGECGLVVTLPRPRLQRWSQDSNQTNSPAPQQILQMCAEAGAGTWTVNLDKAPVSA